MTAVAGSNSANGNYFYSPIYESGYGSAYLKGDYSYAMGSAKFCAIMSSAADENGSYCKVRDVGGSWVLYFGKTRQSASLACQAVCLSG